MTVIELSGGSQEVVSTKDGKLPAPDPVSEFLVGLDDGRLFIREDLPGGPEIDSYLERFSNYLATSGRDKERTVTRVKKEDFHWLLSKIRRETAVLEPPTPESPPTATNPPDGTETLPEDVFPDSNETPVPESLSEKAVLLPDGRIAATEDLRGDPEFARFARQYSMGMEAAGNIGHFRIVWVDDRALRNFRGEGPIDLLGEDPDLGSEPDLSFLENSPEEGSPLSFSDPVRESPEPSSGEGVVPLTPGPNALPADTASGALTSGTGKESPEEEKGSSRDRESECLSNPSVGAIPDFRAPDDIASMVLLFLDGRFYVSREHRTNQHVNYYYRHFVPELWPKIFGEKPRPKPQFVTYETLRKIRRDSLPEEALAAGYKAEGDEGRKIMEILREAIAGKASDIHLRIERDRTRILYRLHGWLQPVQTLTHDEGERLSKIIYNTMLDSAGRDNMFSDKKPQDGQFRQDYLPRGVSNIRESHVPTGGTGLGTITMVLRLQYGSGQAGTSSPEIELLGYREDQLAQLRFLVGLSSGIVIFSGPMGSGKTTAIAAMLYLVQLMNPLEKGMGKHIVTMEDPVEYEIPGATQIAVPGGRFVEYSGRTMRIDADYLGIGEVREKDIALAAIADAMSGHMVYTTTHAKDVFTIPRRLDGMEVRRDLLTDPSLFRGLVSQRLVPLLCPDCRISWKEAEKAGILSPGLSKRLENVSLNPEDVFFHRTGGCEPCRNQGIVGRTVVAEILLPDEEILNLIVGGRMTEAKRYYSDKLSGRTMMDHAIEKIRTGSVDPLHVESKLEWLHKGSLDGDTRLEIIGGLG